MRLRASALVVLGLVLLPAIASAANPSTTTLRAGARPTRTLVGDWEPPDVVGLVYSDSWAAAFADLVDALAREVPVMLLTEHGLTAEQTVASVHALPEASHRNVDLFLQFVEPTVALLARFDPSEASVDARNMDLVAAALDDAARAMDLPLVIERVDLPPPTDEFYCSWLNYFRVRDVVLVPSYAAVDRGLQAAAHERRTWTEPGSAATGDLLLRPRGEA